MWIMNVYIVWVKTQWSRYAKIAKQNECIYSVGEDIVEQICQNSKTECFADIRGLSKKTKTKQNKIKNKKRSKMLELL